LLSDIIKRDNAGEGELFEDGESDDDQKSLNREMFEEIKYFTGAY